MGGTRAEIEHAFRTSLKRIQCLGCGIDITDAAIDWGDAQPREYDKDGPFHLKCEPCATIQEETSVPGRRAARTRAATSSFAACSH